MRPGVVRRNLRRGVYVVPTTLTVLNIFFGFVAILLSIRGMQARIVGDPVEAGRLFQLACFALLVAAVFDTFDGLVARLMHATSEFGKEYDSLADVVTFGAAPAILVWSWALNVFPRLGGGIAFLFLVGGSLRLARFNISTAKTDHRYFVGLPIPAAALTIAAIINFAPYPVTDEGFAAIILLVVVGLAFAMVSTIRYRSQKYASLQKERSGMYFLVFALILVVMFKWPAEFLFLLAIVYVSSGPLIRLWSIAFPSRRAAPPAPDGADTLPAP
ncbi:MAG: CDP-diacylglycerol--serine O-phosphatidyltransferase [Thermoanaerobaculia bacterium]